VTAGTNAVTAFAGKSARFLRDVRGEMRKITWPGGEDLRKSTIVITIIVVVLGIMIGIMDWLFSKILIDLFGRIFG
jgi:preprotein translocase subunit SecE